MKPAQPFHFSFRTFLELLLMKNFRLNQTLQGAALSVTMFAPWSAHASLTSGRVCPSIELEISLPPGAQVPKGCYSGFNCTVGMRGDWLDITHRVEFSSLGIHNGGPQPYARPSIAERGSSIRASNSCVGASQNDKEGYVAVLLEEVKGDGLARVTAKRRGFLGHGEDEDSVDFYVQDGIHFLHPVQRAALTARVGEVKIIDLTGRGLKDLRVKVRPPTTTANTAKPAASRMAASVANVNARTAANLDVRTTATLQQPLSVPTPPVSIVSQSYDQLRLKVNFDKQGTFSLADYVEFTVGFPAINRDLGWPSITVQP